MGNEDCIKQHHVRIFELAQAQVLGVVVCIHKPSRATVPTQRDGKQTVGNGKPIEGWLCSTTSL